MRELAGDISLLSINTATVREQLVLPAIIGCVEVEIFSDAWWGRITES
jgi:hypothetical protein